MIEGLDWEALGRAVGMVSIGMVAAWRIVAGYRKETGSPPPERAPAPHEVREAIADLRRVIDGMRQSLDNHDDDHRQIARQLDRIENRLDLRQETWRDRSQPQG